jgi:hypothetical protein
MKSCLLCLLLLSAATDDGLATTTPGPEDDAAAAENNEFLPQPRSAQAARFVRASLAPPPGLLHPPSKPWSAS